ncbi:MAG: acylphosphatase [Betaproteobacteria bacterium]|nr:acylphosphatase [Betaproteobacteria bacterium]
MESRRLIIQGIVQGVAYRYHMTEAARALGVCGWVRNRSDGTVEALVSGDAAAVAAIIAWARHGPPSARVSHVAVEMAEESGEVFMQRPGI